MIVHVLCNHNQCPIASVDGHAMRYIAATGRIIWRYHVLSGCSHAHFTHQTMCRWALCSVEKPRCSMQIDQTFEVRRPVALIG